MPSIDGLTIISFFIIERRLRCVHSFMLPRQCLASPFSPAFRGFCMLVFETVLCLVMWPNQDTSRCITVYNKGSCFQLHILLHIYEALIEELKRKTQLLKIEMWTRNSRNSDF